MLAPHHCLRRLLSSRHLQCKHLRSPQPCFVNMMLQHNASLLVILSSAATVQDCTQSCRLSSCMASPTPCERRSTACRQQLQKQPALGSVTNFSKPGVTRYAACSPSISGKRCFLTSIKCAMHPNLAATKWTCSDTDLPRTEVA